MQLVACSRCNRHIQVSATQCPFCGTATVGRPISRLLDFGGKLSRAAIFAGAAACTTSSPSTTQVKNAPPPPDNTPIETTSTATFAQPPPGDGQTAQPAPAPGSIEGVALNGDTGGPIPQAQVMLMTQTGALNVTADAQGRFAFKDLPPGGYEIQFQNWNGNPHQNQPTAYAQVKAGEMVHVVLQSYATVQDRGPCCKPYGAPPARRRVV